MVQVQVTPADSVASCEINGIPAQHDGNMFFATVPLEVGSNTIIATCVAVDGSVAADTIRVERLDDDTPPTSEVVVSDDRNETSVIFRDESGIASIEVEVLTNGEIDIEDFEVGDKEVEVTIRRIDPSEPLTWTIVATDLCGNTLRVDPVWLQYTSGQDPDSYSFEIFDFERYLYIINNGLKQIEIELNQYKLVVKAHPRYRGRDGQTYYIPVEGEALIDLLPYLKQGTNDVRLFLSGPEGTSGLVVFSDVDFGLSDRPLDGIDVETLPLRLTLYPNYPNPFNPETRISFDVPRDYMEAVQVRLMIYNLRGRLVRSLVDGELYAGHYEFVWDGTDAAGVPVASGVYIYRLIVGQQHTARRMTMLK